MEPFDCEILRAAAFPEQPVNTWSSLVFLAAAVVLWRRGHRIAGAALALALHVSVRPMSFLGIGFFAYSNRNEAEPFGGSGVMIELGLLR